MKREKYLPIGSVVLLKNGKKRVMVTGFAATPLEEDDKMYDYMGCLYPEGVISSDKNLLFDHEQIEEIYYMGYIDDEWKQVETKIKEIVEKKLQIQQEEEKTPEQEEQKPVNLNTTDLFN